MMTGYVKLFNGNKNRGDYTEITYYNETGEQADPEEAVRVCIKEILASGEVVKETWGYCGEPRRKPA